MWNAVQSQRIEKCFRHTALILPSRSNEWNANDENDNPFEEPEFRNIFEKFQFDITFAEFLAADNSLEVSEYFTEDEIIKIIHEECS